MAQNIHEDVTTTATSPARPLAIGGLIAAVVAGAATAAVAAVGEFRGPHALRGEPRTASGGFRGPGPRQPQSGEDGNRQGDSACSDEGGC
jgi:hypothetical protein